MCVDRVGACDGAPAGKRCPLPLLTSAYYFCLLLLAPAYCRLPSAVCLLLLRAEPLPILARDDERFHHLRVDEVAVELVQLS